MTTVDLSPAPNASLDDLYERFRDLHPGAWISAWTRPPIEELDDSHDVDVVELGSCCVCSGGTAGARWIPNSVPDCHRHGRCYCSHCCPLCTMLGRDACQCPPPASGVR